MVGVADVIDSRVPVHGVVVKSVSIVGLFRGCQEGCDAVVEARCRHVTCDARLAVYTYRGRHTSVAFSLTETTALSSSRSAAFSSFSLTVLSQDIRSHTGTWDVKMSNR